jgi:hypothetical protein
MAELVPAIPNGPRVCFVALRALRNDDGALITSPTP